MRTTEPTTDEYLNKATRLLKQMIKQSRRRKIMVLQTRVALAELVAASKYKGSQEHDEIEVA